MRNIKICSLKLFDIQNISDCSFFYKIKIKTYSNVISSKNIHKNVSYYNKKIVKITNYHNINLFNDFKFIKTTGSHVSNGFLLTQNYKLNKRSIKNHEIYNILREFLHV